MSQTNEKALNRAGLKYLWQLMLNKLPKKTSQLTNDSGFITSNDIPEGAAASTTRRLALKWPLPAETTGTPATPPRWTR